MSGYKTYIVALALLAYGLLGYALGDMPALDAIKAALEGAGLGALRAGIANA